MAFVGSINLNGGETFSDGIDTYLQMRSEGLTSKTTVLNLNDIEYPIGYFNRDNIDLFRLGMTTLQNLSHVLDKGGDSKSDSYKAHSDYFIDETFKVDFDDPYDYEDMLEAFSDIAETWKFNLFDEDQWKRIREQRDAKIKEAHEASITK